MFRCAFAVATAFALAMPAGAQVQRNFPQNALRGEIMIGTPPEITLNGAATRLAPGARIRNQNNLLEMSGALVGNKFVAHYTTDLSGLVRDVWILRSEEIANKPWPTTSEEAARWSFDPIAQTWTKR